MRTWTTWPWVGAIALAALAPGCGDPGRPRDASPIVSPDSEAGKKAAAEAESFLKLRQEQEAAAHRRGRAVPVEG